MQNHSIRIRSDGCIGPTITIIYSPIDVLVQMDSDSLRHSLARAKLVCRWLEGILEFAAELDAANPDKEGK